MVDIGLGNNCNNCCVMCTNIMPPPKNYNGPPKHQIITQLKKLDKNIDSILLTGGEPTIRKDFFYILKYINRKFPKAEIKVITNARMFYYTNFINKIKPIKNLNIITELYGSCKEVHDLITQTEGSFKQSFDGIKNLLSNNFKVELRIVVNKLNCHDILNIAKIYSSEFKKADRIVIFPIDIVGNARKYREKTTIKYTEIIPFIEETLKFLRGKNVEVYHVPYCILDKKYWKFIGGLSVNEKRVVFAPFCRECVFEKKCPRIWGSYAKLVGLKEFKAIKNGPIKS